MKPTPNREPTAADYTAAVRAHKAEINRCGQTHQMPPKGSEVTITITPRGKARLIELAPANLNATPFGMCIKNVLSGASYPAAKVEQKVSVKLNVT